MALDFPASPSNNQQFTGPGGVQWVWDSQKWISGSLATGTYTPLYGNVGRNYVQNSMFNISQRGNGAFIVLDQYTVDRWIPEGVTDTVSITRNAMTDAYRTAIGDDDALWMLRYNFVGTGGAGAYSYLTHRIEGVRRLGGKTVVVSFWATATIAATKLGINILQNFGTGGSPTGPARALATGASVTLTTAWARYSVTIPVPSTSGGSITLGSNNNDYSGLEFWGSSGAATAAAVAGNPGVQTAGVWLWGVQLEVGNVATPLEKLDPAIDLQRCQRFYVAGIELYQAGTATASQTFGTCAQFPVTMRATPATVAFTPTGNVNLGTVTATGITPTSALFFATVTATAQTALRGTYTASADLT